MCSMTDINSGSPSDTWRLGEADVEHSEMDASHFSVNQMNMNMSDPRKRYSSLTMRVQNVGLCVSLFQWGWAGRPEEHETTGLGG